MEEYTQVTLDEWTQWKEDIRQKLAETANNFVYIGYRLKQIRDSGMFGGAADVFEFAQREYGLGKSTVSRFIAINEKYSEGGNSLELKEEFRAFSSSKLAEMLTLPDNEIQLITEKTTIKEIRELKDFNRQQAQQTEEEMSAWTPLGRCLIDFFESRKEMLNGIMGYLNEEPPEYKKAAELMNPSGQASHKKGIAFLFLYDWNTGVKYKLMTQPDPVSITWQELLDNIFHIYESCNQSDVWEDFYGTMEENIPKEENENSVPHQSNQGLEPSVATSQQDENEMEAADYDKEPKETHAPDGEPESESGETAQDVSENGADRQPEQSKSNAEKETIVEAEELKQQNDEESTNGSSAEKEIPVEAQRAETPGPTEQQEEYALTEQPGKYERQIQELIEELAYKSKQIEVLQTGERQEFDTYQELKRIINTMGARLEQLIRFIDLSDGI